MNKKETKISSLSRKILNGVRLASKKMVERKRRNNGEIVILENGKVVVLPAKEIKE